MAKPKSFDSWTPEKQEEWRDKMRKIQRNKNSKSERNEAIRISEIIGFEVSRDMIRNWKRNGYRFDCIKQLRKSLAKQQRLPLGMVIENHEEMALYAGVTRQTLRNWERKGMDVSWSNHKQVKERGRLCHTYPVKNLCARCNINQRNKKSIYCLDCAREYNRKRRGTVTPTGRPARWTIPEGMRWCRDCDQILSAQYFRKMIRESRCHECEKKYGRKLGYKIREQSAADQFFVMTGAMKQISEALTNKQNDSDTNKPESTD